MFGLFYFRDVSLCVGACGSRVDFVERFPSNFHILSIVLPDIKNSNSKLSATTERQGRENKPKKPPERVAHFLAGLFAVIA